MKTITTWWPKGQTSPRFPEACSFCKGQFYGTVSVKHRSISSAFEIPYCDKHIDKARSYLHIVQQAPSPSHGLLGWVAGIVFSLVVLLISIAIFGNRIEGIAGIIVALIVFGGGASVQKEVRNLLWLNKIKKELSKLEGPVDEIGFCLGMILDVFNQPTQNKVRLDFSFKNDDYATMFQEAQAPENLSE